MSRTIIGWLLSISLVLSGCAGGGETAAVDSASTPLVSPSATAGGVSSPVAPTASASKAGWTLTWSDEFNAPDGSAPDASKWTLETGGGGFGNHELEYYTARRANSYQQGGSLVIQARKESYTGPDGVTRAYTSARLKTDHIFSQAYGRFEARIKIPYGKGLWPAFWMLGSDIHTVGWPTCGEVDIMENIGSEPSTNHGSVHGPGYSGGSAISRAYVLPNGQKLSDDFHLYAAEWAPGVIRFYVDDLLYQTVTPQSLPSGSRWVFDHPFFILLNVAVGGDWPGAPDSSTVFPQFMLVDYVRVYSQDAITPTPTPTPTPVPAGSAPTWFLLHGGALSLQPGTAAQVATIPSAGGRNYDGTPNLPQTWVLSNLTGTWSGQSTRFHLYLDAGSAVGDGTQVRVSYDFTGDGTYDCIETYAYFALNNVPGFEDYAQTRGLRSSTGAYADMRGGTARVEIWNAIGTSPVLLRTDAPAGDAQVSAVTLPFNVGAATPTPTPAPTPAPAGSGILYLLNSGSLAPAPGTGSQSATIPSAGGTNHDGSPYQPLVYTARGLTGRWRADLATRFRLAVDAGAHVGDGVQVRVSYDFDGDGVQDRVETFVYFAMNDLAGWEVYDEARGLRSASGAFRDFVGGAVKVEVWCAIGRDAALLRTDATLAQGQPSVLLLPFDF